MADQHSDLLLEIMEVEKLFNAAYQRVLCKNDFIVAEADLSPDRALIGNSTRKKGLATYRELMANVSNKTNQSGRAIAKVMETWVNNIFARAAIIMTQNGETNIERVAEELMLQDCRKYKDSLMAMNFLKHFVYFGKQVACQI